MPCPTTFFSRFFIQRGFKNKNDVCHILCEELFMLGITRSQVDIETEFVWYWYDITAPDIFIHFSFDEMFLAFCKFLETAKDC